MITAELARQLRDAGLSWEPADGDQFLVPDRGMEDMVFTVSQMSADIHAVEGNRLIGFSGEAEWALDSILQHEVVWLPAEGRLRTAIGDRFRSLSRTSDGYTCEVTTGGGTRAFAHALAEDAYGTALLHLLAEDEVLRHRVAAPSW